MAQGITFSPFMKPVPTQSAGQPATTLQQQGSQDSPWSRYLLRLEAATQDNNTVSSLYAQIGVLNLQLLTTVNATGARAKSAWLTLAMPRGGLLVINRFRGDLSQLRSFSEEKHHLILMPSDMELVHRYHGTWEVKKIRRHRWWHFLTQG